MRRGTSLGACVLGVFALAPGCAGKSIEHKDSGGGDDAGDDGRGGRAGTAGITGNGGTSGTSGTGGTSDLPPTGGSGGAGITGGSSGTGGTGGAPSCGSLKEPIGAPSARSTTPFHLTVGGAGGQGGHAAIDGDELAEGGSGGLPDNGGCEPLTDGHVCVGTAQTTKRGTELSFEFQDGSTLEWTAVGTSFVLPPPVDHGDLVFIAYQHQRRECLFCAEYTQTSVTFWDSQQRQTLWRGIEGSALDEVEPEFIASLFGTPYRRTISCVSDPYELDCYVVTRGLYDHVLETMPEQWIRHATPTRVTTPRGTFEVVWASSEQSEVLDPDCADGAAPARDRGFAASRLDPAPF